MEYHLYLTVLTKAVARIYEQGRPSGAGGLGAALGSKLMIGTFFTFFLRVNFKKLLNCTATGQYI